MKELLPWILLPFMPCLQVAVFLEIVNRVERRKVSAILRDARETAVEQREVNEDTPPWMRRLEDSEL